MLKISNVFLRGALVGPGVFWAQTFAKSSFILRILCHPLFRIFFEADQPGAFRTACEVMAPSPSPRSLPGAQRNKTAGCSSPGTQPILPLPIAKRNGMHSKAAISKGYVEY
ncbi:MAG: hypothetical protein D6730_17165 [Bacteroidetes bacterium]|nr:MAG: hypothetical protein D6730_17165 [Bacteroidota bacterium]